MTVILRFDGSDYKIMRVYDKDEALSILEKKRPDLIITDNSLNMMTGDTLFLYIKMACMITRIFTYIMASTFLNSQKLRS